MPYSFTLPPAQTITPGTDVIPIAYPNGYVIDGYTAGNFKIGVTYTITLVGNTDFTLIGATANTVGTIFIATGKGNIGETGTASAKEYILYATLDQIVSKSLSTGNYNAVVGPGTPKGDANLEVIGNARINKTLFTANSIELGDSGTGNRYAYIDFHGDDTYTDFALRMIRNNTGLDANSEILHRGLGKLNFLTYQAAPITFATTSTERMRIDSVGNTYIESGNLWKYTPTPTTLAAGANAITAVMLQGEIFTNSVTTAVTMTLPLGTDIDTGFGFGTAFANINIGLDFYVQNNGTAAGAITVAVNPSITTVDNLTVAVGTYAHFRLRRTGTGTYILYRIG